MSKQRPRGRPKTDEIGTKLVRLPADLVEMVTWLARIEKRTAAQIIDPLVRPEVESRYSLRFADIAAIKAAEDLAAHFTGPIATRPKEFGVIPGAGLPPPRGFEHNPNDPQQLLAIYANQPEMLEKAKRELDNAQRLRDWHVQLIAHIEGKKRLTADELKARVEEMEPLYKSSREFSQLHYQLWNYGHGLKKQFPPVKEPDLPAESGPSASPAKPAKTKPRRKPKK